MYVYKTHGTCSKAIEIELDGDKIASVNFINGCTGNTHGISRLVKGMQVDDVISKLKGIPCQGATSCPDQLARALEEMKAKGLQ